MTTLADLKPLQPPSTTPGGKRLLDAASQLFYHHGVAATGLDLVVERAGVTKRTLYQRFGSKDGLIRAYLATRAFRWQSLVLDRVQQAIDDGSDPLAGVFDLTHEWVTDNPRGCGFVNAWAELGDSCSTETQSTIRQEKEWMQALFVLLTGEDETGKLVHELYEGGLVCAAIMNDLEAISRAKAGALQLAKAVT